MTSTLSRVDPNNNQMTFGRDQSPTLAGGSDPTLAPTANKATKSIENLNRQFQGVLPPEVEGPSFGHLFVEMGQMDWFTYDSVNYLQDGTTANRPIFNLFTNIKFWGDRNRGLFLKCENGRKKGETATNKYKYDIKCPERTFEKYLDDMGVLIVDFFDTQKNQVVGTSKIMLKLYIKRAKKDGDDQPLLELRGSFPITLTGNQNVKIGQFNISMVSSFPTAAAPQSQQNTGNSNINMMNRQQISLDDSFEENERLATQMATKGDKNRQIVERAFSDDRVPSSLQYKKNDSQYLSDQFGTKNDFEIDIKPTRERATTNNNRPNTTATGKENQRNVINIDENEDTFHNLDAFQRIFSRGEKLRQQMDQALTQDTAWEALHGPHQPPKKYVPPFLQNEEEKKDQMDFLYELEYEGYDLTQSKGEQNQTNNLPQQHPSSSIQNQGNMHLSEMKFIKIKINSLRIENEELLHELLDQTFMLSLELPLPDIYQKGIGVQHLKLSNYDIISFNEFAYNNSSLYNFKIDEETYNQLINSSLKVQLADYQVSGSISMLKLLMNKTYKLEVSIPLERVMSLEDTTTVPTQQTKKRDQSQGKKSGKQAVVDPKKKPSQKEPVSKQNFMKHVGHLSIELSLQRGDNEQELARDYQIKLQQLTEQKAKEEQERQAEQQKYARFSQQQEPTFAQLYLNISSIRNLCVNTDGTLNKQLHDESFNLRQQPPSLSPSPRLENEQSIVNPKRNLFVQYKAFPTLEKLKTNTVWQETEPKFVYRTQFPIIVNPETIGKLQNFTFVLEVWDAVTPSREEFIGLVKIPLASFCYSMRTTDEQIFSLNFLADQHALYPMLISDGFQPIYSPRLGVNVGELSVTLAMGSAVQVSRQIQREQDHEKSQLEMLLKTHMVELMKTHQATNIIKVEVPSKVEETVIEHPTPDATPVNNVQDGLLSGFNSLLKGNQQQQDQGIMKNINNFLRQSLNISTQSKGDMDLRRPTHLSCLRKLFEEARASGVELNGEGEVFNEVMRQYDGTIKKEDFIYAILNTKAFTLTRSEIANICALVMEGQGGVANGVDVDELQRSYKSYLTYYDSIEARIKDLLEKFQLSLNKKLTTDEDYEDFISQLESKGQESKILTSEFRDHFDNHGIFIREALYDQLASYFDLDRNDHLYLPSILAFFRNPSMNSFNFFKVHPIIIVNLVAEYIKNELLLNRTQQQMGEQQLEVLEVLEREIKSEKHREQGKSGVLEEIPEDFLVNEKITAKSLQSLLKKHSIHLSQWELFTLFEHLNTTYNPKLYYEPQRCQVITFPQMYRFVTNGEYEAKIKEETLKRQLAKQLAEQMLKASTESVFALASELNRKKGDLMSDGGIYSNKEDDMLSDEEVVIKDEKGGKGKGGKAKREMTFAQKDSQESILDGNETKPQVSDDNRPYRKVKHIFEIRVKELKNIPILDKLIKDTQSYESAMQAQTLSRGTTIKKDQSANKYIQNVAVKYSFPLDEDDLFQSDYIQLNNEALTEFSQYDYKVSINTVHNYVMNKDEPIQNLLKSHSSNNTSDSLFNISLVIYDNSKEFVIGNAQLPIEDLIDMIDMHSLQQNTSQNGKQTLQRILFIYGTTFSQRENCIIGKMQIEINYGVEKQYLPAEQVLMDENGQPISNQVEENDSPACFLHRETYIKRKIPLQAIIQVEIDRVHNIKESIENIEHFSKIQGSAMRETEQKISGKMSSVSRTSKNPMIAQAKDQADRRRILTQIFKQGLNLCVIASLFEENTELNKRFTQGKHTTRMLYNTLNPVFNEGFEVPVQMDTQIFEYLKNKRAVFEIRHYIIESKRPQTQNNGLTNWIEERRAPEDSNRSQVSEEEKEKIAESDYIVLGFVRVPLLHLITKNNGIDGDFVIFDEYKQQIGSLKIRINLNHHSSKRPLYSETQKFGNQITSAAQTSNLRGTVIDRTLLHSQTLARTGAQGLIHEQTQNLLCLNFVELIFKNRESLLQQLTISQQNSFFYLKFGLLGQNYQTKFLSQTSSNGSQFLKQLQISVFDIKKTVILDLDFANLAMVEEAFSKPLEIQLWLKKEAANRYQQAEKDQLLGSFFIEINELTKIRNKKVREANGILQSYEGYFTLYDYERDQVVPDRLGCRVMLIKKEYDTQLADLEVLFHNLQPLEQQLISVIDPNCKGYAFQDELSQAIDQHLQDPYRTVLKALLQNSEFKDVDRIYYSSLFGQISPHFRYAKRFDSFGVIEKFNKELMSLDSHSQGFVPLALFRSVMEHELKIKERIVMDFIQNLRDCDNNGQLQTLDVNITSNSLKSHIDYVLLLRKLALYYELKGGDKSFAESGTQPTLNIQQDEVILRIDIESAMRLRNPLNTLEPPNSFVVLRLPFSQVQPSKLQTQTIQSSSYPAWHQVNQQVKFTLTLENIKMIIANPIEFEVYHAQLGIRDTVAHHLIGVSYVDLSQLVFVDGVYQLGGYFHIVNKDKFKEGQSLNLVDPSILSSESLGQIKLGVTSNINLKSLAQQNPLSRSIVKENSPFKEKKTQQNEVFQYQEQNNNFVSFSRDTLYNSNVNFALLSQTHQKMEYSLNKANIELCNKPETDLKSVLSQKMNELDELNRTLNQKSRQNDSQDDSAMNRIEEFKAQESHQNFDPYSSQMAVTLGYSQSADLQQQLAAFSKKPTYGNPLNLNFNHLSVNIIQEQADDNESFKEDSFRRENVFENNISQSNHSEQEANDSIQPGETQNFLEVSQEQQQDYQDGNDEFPVRQTFGREGNIFEKNQMAAGAQEKMQEEQEVIRQMSEIKPSTRRFLDDEDDMMSEEEMRRIDRILKSSQNK